MKRKLDRKMTLSRETLHKLTGAELADVAGGRSLIGGSCHTCRTQCDTDLTCSTVLTCFPCPV